MKLDEVYFRSREVCVNSWRPWPQFEHSERFNYRLWLCWQRLLCLLLWFRTFPCRGSTFEKKWRGGATACKFTSENFKRLSEWASRWCTLHQNARNIIASSVSSQPHRSSFRRMHSCANVYFYLNINICVLCWRKRPFLFRWYWLACLLNGSDVHGNSPTRNNWPEALALTWEASFQLLSVVFTYPSYVGWFCVSSP